MIDAREHEPEHVLNAAKEIPDYGGILTFIVTGKHFIGCWRRPQRWLSGSNLGEKEERGRKKGWRREQRKGGEKGKRRKK